MTSDRFSDHFNEVVKDFSTLGASATDPQSIKLLLTNMSVRLAFCWSEKERIIPNEYPVLSGLNLFSARVTYFPFSTQDLVQFRN